MSNKIFNVTGKVWDFTFLYKYFISINSLLELNIGNSQTLGLLNIALNVWYSLIYYILNIWKF